MARKKWTELDYFEDARRLADNLWHHYGESINDINSFNEKIDDYMSQSEEGRYALNSKKLVGMTFNQLKMLHPTIRGDFAGAGKVVPREPRTPEYKIPKPSRRERALVRQQTARTLPVQFKYPVTLKGIPTYARRVRMKTRYGTHYYAYRAINGRLAKVI